MSKEAKPKSGGKTKGNSRQITEKYQQTKGEVKGTRQINHIGLLNEVDCHEVLNHYEDEVDNEINITSM